MVIKGEVMMPWRVSQQTYIFILGVLALAFTVWWYRFRPTYNEPHFFNLFQQPHVNLDKFLEQQQKYLKGGQLALVTFPVKADYSSAHTSLKRRGILYTTPHALATIIVCHGFMCDKFDISFIRKTLFSGYNVFAFDFRAHGELVEPSHCCTFGRDEALDVIGAADFIRSRDDIKHLPILCYGFSMGAVAAIQAQAQKSDLFKALILDCPYDSSQNVVKRCIDHLKFTIFGYTFGLPGRSLLRKFAFNPFVQGMIKRLLKTIAQLDALTVNTTIYPLNPAHSIKNVKIPCFFIHCVHDDRIYKNAAHQLFENAAGYKRLWVTNGRRHFDSVFYNPEKYVYKVNTFVQDVLSGRHLKKAPEKMHYDDPIIPVKSNDM